jgi:hypothetical protein
MQTNDLTEQEQNLIKDILKAIGNDDFLNAQFARGVGMSQVEFNGIADKIFEKLGNGRVTFDIGGENRLI